VFSVLCNCAHDHRCVTLTPKPRSLSARQGPLLAR
jgi:hypothetical protein